MWNPGVPQEQSRVIPADAKNKPNVFIDAIAARHLASTSAQLLDKRQLAWEKNYGWTYDVVVTEPGKYALAGANGRFAVPALAGGFFSTIQQATKGLQAAVMERVIQIEDKEMQQR